MKPSILRQWRQGLIAGLLGCATAAEPSDRLAAIKAGERLFFETRFAQFFAERCGDNVNARLTANDPVLKAASSDRQVTLFATESFAWQSMSCRACHLSPDEDARRGLVQRAPIPDRGDGHRTTPRNSPPLFGAVVPGRAALLHFDGEFASAEDLVIGTFAGRNFGWLPDEAADARRHFARVIREDDGAGALAGNYANLPYAVWLRGSDTTIPVALRLPEADRFNPIGASDEDVFAACARLVAVYLESLQFSHDVDGQHDGSPYDAFLTANRLPRAPARDETPPVYARRLLHGVLSLGAPRYVDDPARSREQPFRFGEKELLGLKIFFREGVGKSQAGGAGNCIECHVPPHFADFAFHNTGEAQEDFDELNGDGAFSRLELPGADERAADYDRWLSPTSKHPRAAGNFLAPSNRSTPMRTDLGLWNVYANPDLPGPQAELERLLNPNGRFTRDEVLAQTLGRFKTSTVRDLSRSAPYLHTGRLRTIEDVVLFYQRTSSLTHEGKLRNAPPQFFGTRLEVADVEPLTAFLRALNEGDVTVRR